MLSSIGFGNQKFGEEPFGGADWAEEVTWKVLPQFLRDSDSASQEGLVKQPLRHFINAIKPLFNDIRFKYQIFPTLWDAINCPFPQLASLAYNIGLTISSVQTIGLNDLVIAPFQIGERFVNSTRSATGIIASINSNLITLTSVTTGFVTGDQITSETTGYTVTVESVTGSIPNQLLTVSTFMLGETIQGSISGTKGIVGSVAIPFLNVDTVTGLGFRKDETITGLSSKASGVINEVKIDGKTEGFLRNKVLNANQLWLSKGTNKSYKIIGAFEGLQVEITELWSENCDADPNGTLLFPGRELGPYIGNFDYNRADVLPLDKLFNSRSEAWPIDVDSVLVEPGLPDGICRSHTIDLHFSDPNDLEIEDFDSVANRIIQDVNSFKPIHIDVRKITFSGTSASTEIWNTGPIYSDNSDAAIFSTALNIPSYASSNIWSTLDLPVANI